MQSRKKSWILMMIGIAVVSFLVGFQPVRTVVKKGPPDSTFKFNLPEPINDSERDAKAAEIKDALKTSGVDDVDKVSFPDKSILQVETLALTDDAVKADEHERREGSGQAVPGHARDQEDGRDARDAAVPTGQRAGSLSSAPGHQARSGPAGRRARCPPLPAADQDELLHPVGRQADGSARLCEHDARSPAAPAAAGLPTAPELTQRVKAVLVRNGVPEDEAIVKMVADNLITVETRANDKRPPTKSRRWSTRLAAGTVGQGYSRPTSSRGRSTPSLLTRTPPTRSRTSLTAASTRPTCASRSSRSRAMTASLSSCWRQRPRARH